MPFTKNISISIISFLVVLAASFWFWNSLKAIIAAENIIGSLIMQAGISFAVSLVFIAINFTVSRKQIGILTAIILPIVFAVFFIRDFNKDKILLIVAGASIVLAFFAYFTVFREKSQRLKLNISGAKTGMNIYFLIALLLLTALLYQYNFSKGQVKLSASQIQYLMPMIEGQIKAQVPFYSQEMTTDELLVISALSSGEITIIQKDLTPDLQKKVQEKIAKDGASMAQALQYPEVQKLIIDNFIKNNPKTMAKLRSDYGEKFGIEIKKDQSLVATLADGVNSFIEKILSPYKNYLPIVLAVTFFFSFKVLGFLFVDVALFIAGIIFFILKNGGVLNIANKSVMQEVIE